jgi:hypothetical protein
VNYGSALLAVTGNTIRGNGRGTGISLRGGSGQLTVASAGNAVSGVATAVSVGSGVSVSGGLQAP